MAAMVLNHPKLLVMSDYDGTLVPIQKRPELAVPDESLLDILSELGRHASLCMAVISGRDREDLRKLIPFKEITLIGGHGAEIPEPLSDGSCEHTLSGFQNTLDVFAEAALKEVKGLTGFLVERKRVSVALHYRLADQDYVESVIRGFILRASPYLGNEFEVIHGKKVLEIRSCLAGKDKAVKKLMDIKKDYFPLYIGDDTTDEDAFVVVRESGLTVLVSDEPEKKSAARYRLKNTQEVLELFKIICTRC